MTVLTLLVAGAVVWVPGSALARAYGVDPWRCLVIGPALSWCAIGLGAVAAPRAGLRWGPFTALAGCALLALPAAPRVLRRRGRDRGRARPAERVDQAVVRQVLLAGAGVACAAALVTTTSWRAHVRPGDVDQLWDAVWHANLTAFIASTGSSDPTRAPGQLLGAGWRTVDSLYPDALHAGAALVVQLTGAPVPLALGSVVLVVYALLLPVATAALTWTLTGGNGAGAGVAAVVSELAVVYPTDHWWRGEWAYGTSLASGLLAAAVGVRALQGRLVAGSPWRSTLLGAGALTGVALVQPAGAVVAVLLVAGWSAGLLLRLPWRWAAAGALVVAAVVAAFPAGVDAATRRSTALGSLAAYDYRDGSDRVQALHEVLALVRPSDPALGYPVPVQAPQHALLAVFLVAALVASTSRRTAWLGLLWALLVAAAVDTLAPVAAPLHSLTLFFYSSSYRVLAVVTAVGAVMAGVALDRAARCRLWHVVRTRLLGHPGAGVRAGAWALAAAVAAVGIAGAAVLAAGTVERGQVRMRAGYAPRVVGPSQETVMTALAAQPLPTGARVLNDPVDGSPWMYALTGVEPLFTHYARGDVPPRVRTLLRHLDEVDTDPAVQADLRAMRVCYVYTNATTVTARRHRARGLTSLDGATSLQLVARSGPASAYRVLVPGTPCAP